MALNNKSSQSLISSATEKTYNMNGEKSPMKSGEGKKKPALVRTQTGLWVNTENPKDNFRHEKRSAKKKKAPRKASVRKKREKSADTQKVLRN